MSDTFCAFAWVQTVRRTHGSIGPCCMANSPCKTVEEYYNSTWIKDIRTKMLAGEPVNECRACYQSEQQFGTSARTQTNRYYKFVAPKYHERTLKYYKWDELTYPKRLELHVSNLCNLKCLTCRPEDSSSFLAENNALGISTHRQQDYAPTDAELEEFLSKIKLDQLDLLDLRGGESMLVPRIKQFLKKIAEPTKLNLRIQTNGTIFDAEWQDILSRFKSVEFMFSIDAYGADNTYIRFPAKWTDIEHTVQMVGAMPNTQIFVNTVTSNLNLLVLPKLFDWIISNNLELSLSPVEWPPEFNVLNLPKSVRHRAVDNLRQYQNRFNNQHTNQALDDLINFVYNSTQDLDLQLWQQFCQTIQKRDQYRKNSIFDVLPELRPYAKTE
jgi:molybdenum cofactor biosynthesis enzyme MoaA